LGPNGALLYTMEYLLENLDWLHEALESFQDDYLLLDCPGQVELYTHCPVITLIDGSSTRVGYEKRDASSVDAAF
jgi:GTPase SAR1 family protein